MSKPKKKTVLWVYLGRRHWVEGSKHSIRHAYVPLESLGELAEYDAISHFAKPLGTSPRSSDVILGVYEGEIADTTDRVSAYGVGHWKYKRRIDDPTLNTELAALDIAAMGELSFHKEKEKAKKQDHIYEALEPIRQAMMRSNAAGRRAILAKVMLRLTVH